MGTQTHQLSAEQLLALRNACSCDLSIRGQSDDKVGTEAAIGRIYERIGLPKPIVLWMPNPVQLTEAPFLLQSLASVPHGTQRRTLRRSNVHVPPSDFGWQL